MTVNLLNKLKQWRTETAAKEGVEPFRVFPNQTLEAIAAFQPKTKEDVLSIKGIREKKFAKYGTAILALTNGDDPTVKSTRREDTDALSVSAFLDSVNEVLRQQRARIQGEVGSFEERNGVFYFSLKDPEDGSTLNCLIWKSAYDMCGVDVEVGMEIIVEGTPDVYKPSGRFSLKALSVELVGEGALQKQYEKLKAQLQKEGLFDVARKRPVPILPQKIGLITSRTGAAIGDFQTNLGRYGFQILFIDSRVEGQLAVPELISAMRTFKNRDIDVLVLIRGGGSMESLQPFNNELLVREVINFPVPVIAGIGHEKDVPLVALAADKMVSTPTAAAQALGESWRRAIDRIELDRHKMLTLFRTVLDGRKSFVQTSFNTMRTHVQNILDDFKTIEHSLSRFTATLGAQIAEIRRTIARYPSTISHGMNALLSTSRQSVVSLEKQLILNDPNRQLKLGYSIVRSRVGIVRSVTQVSKGEDLSIRMQDGSITTQVTEIGEKR